MQAGSDPKSTPQRHTTFKQPLNQQHNHLDQSYEKGTEENSIEMHDSEVKMSANSKRCESAFASNLQRILKPSAIIALRNRSLDHNSTIPALDEWLGGAACLLH
jgi:hypothetical protein